MVRCPQIILRVQKLVGWDHHEEHKKRMGDHVFDEGKRATMSDSQKPNLDKKWLYDDLSTVSLQFSYVICFASILPVAPLFALLVISLELKSDLCKYLFLGQRPSPTRASGVGIWLGHGDFCRCTHQCSCRFPSRICLAAPYLLGRKVHKRI